jgi:RNA polymerase sigma-70 factor (ECF subfamily)
VKPSLPAFEKIIAENEKKIFNTIYSYVSNYEDALDLTQETFLQAYRSLDSFRGEADISTWLYRIAINLCKKHFNKKGRWEKIIAGSADAPEIQPEVMRISVNEASADEVVIMEERDQTVQSQVASLPAKYKTVIVLKYLQDLSYEQIADILNIRIGTVKSRLNRAKKMLKEKLKPLVEP